jgi:hypothetical protein
MKHILFVILFTLQFFIVWGQYDCHNSIDDERVAQVQKILNQQINKNYSGQHPMVRLALHNVRRTDGTGGNSWTAIRDVVDGLSDFYSPHDICFTVISENNIDNDTYFGITEFGGNPTWEDLITVDRVNGAINVYFVSDAGQGGRATGFLFGDDFPTATLANTVTGGDNIVRSTFNSAVLAHEIGHCLGLFHTHQFRATIDNDGNVTAIIREQIPRTGNLANCTTEGDLLCDTPADPGLSISTANVDNETSCSYIGGATLNNLNYAPDTRNVMSYTLPACMQSFTVGQGNRARDFILSGVDLDDYVIREDITISGTFNDNRYYGTENTITSSINHTGGEVTYEAKNKITLQDGFKINANTNTSFHAKLGVYKCTEPLTPNFGRIISQGNNTIRGVNFLPSERLNFSMFPNPTNGSFTMNIFIANHQQVEIFVTDLTGKKILTQQKELVSGTNEQLEIDVSAFNQGIYFVTVRTNTEIKTQKLVVE